VLYLIDGTLRIEHEIDGPERFVEEFWSGKLTRR